MGVIKILFQGRPVAWLRLRTGETGGGGTPIRCVRRKFLLRGSEYRVVLKTDAVRNGLLVREDTWVVSLHPATRENFELFMGNWYRRQARKTFLEAVNRWLPMFREAGYAIPAPKLKIYAMRRAWGRCYYTKGLITMNLHLVKTPQPCIDYIVLHELCHFVVSNHSADFYRLVESFMPLWRDADRLLKNFARERKIIR